MKFQQFFQLALVCAATWTVSEHAMAQVYKWTDANGRVHFSDAAPPDQKVDTLDLPEVERSPAQEVSDTDYLERQRKLSRVLEEERLEKEKVKAQAKAEAEKKKAYCERFRNRLARLDASSLVYTENKDGTVKYWEAEDATRLKAEQHAQFDRECGHG